MLNKSLSLNLTIEISPKFFFHSFNILIKKSRHFVKDFIKNVLNNVSEKTENLILYIQLASHCLSYMRFRFILNFLKARGNFFGLFYISNFFKIFSRFILFYIYFFVYNQDSTDSDNEILQTNNEEIDNLQETVCSICLSTIDGNNLDNKDKYILKCKHVFHHDCIRKWFNHHNTCPCCRNVEFEVRRPLNCNYYDFNNENISESMVMAMSDRDENDHWNFDSRRRNVISNEFSFRVLRLLSNSNN